MSIIMSKIISRNIFFRNLQTNDTFNRTILICPFRLHLVLQCVATIRDLPLDGISMVNRFLDCGA